MKVKLLEKGTFINENFNFNAGEKFPCYYREFSFSGQKVRLEKSNQFSNYGMKHLPYWSVRENETEMTEDEILEILETKYKNFKK